jgi:hypothetical protein
MSKPSDLYGRPWSEREYIIVLHSYMANRNGPPPSMQGFDPRTGALRKDGKLCKPFNSA